MKNKSKFKSMALCAVFSSLTVVLLILGTLLDIFDLTVAAACSLIAVIAMRETGTRYSILMFLSSAVLSIIFIPTSSAAIYFISFFGYFPILLPHLSKQGKILGTVISFLLFNSTMAIDFLLFVKLFGIQNEPWWMYALLIILGNFFFWAYKRAVFLFAFIYEKKLKRIFKL